MVIDTALVATIFTGLTTILTSIAAISATRSRRISANTKWMRRQIRLLQEWAVEVDGYVFMLRRALRQAGVEAPDRPRSLVELDNQLNAAGDDEDDPPPSAKPQEPAAARHRRGEENAS